MAVRKSNSRSLRRRSSQSSLSKRQDNALLKGAGIIALGGFLSKVIGALYRIPLTNILGSDGIGIYQLVFPLYTLFLTFSSAALPQSLSKLVSERIAVGNSYRAQKIFKNSLWLFGLIGLIGGVLMAAFAKVVSVAQGEPRASAAYLMIAPSVFFVAVISCVRGFFQGLNDMRPTAFSQILEQLIKAAAGLSFAYIFRRNIVKAAVFSCLAVTISEIFAALYLLFKVRKKLFKRQLTSGENESKIYSKILKITVPVALSAVLIPLSHLIDSFLIINILGRHTDTATQLYGLYSGGVMTVIGLPIAVCYGIAAALIPVLTKHYALGEADKVQEKTTLSIKYTLLIAVPCAVACFFFPNQIVSVIFGCLSPLELAQMSTIMAYTSPSVIFLALTQTLAACLIAKNKPSVPAISMAIGIIIKIVLEFMLLKSPKISINGAAISCGACYFVASLINLVYINKGGKTLCKTFFYIAVFLALSLPGALAVKFFTVLLGNLGGLLIGGLIFAAVYFALAFKLKLINLNNFLTLKKRRNADDLPNGIDKDGQTDKNGA